MAARVLSSGVARIGKNLLTKLSPPGLRAVGPSTTPWTAGVGSCVSSCLDGSSSASSLMDARIGISIAARTLSSKSCDGGEVGSGPMGSQISVATRGLGSKVYAGEEVRLSWINEAGRRMSVRGYYTYHPGQPKESSFVRNMVCLCVAGVVAGMYFHSSGPKWEDEDSYRGVDWVKRGCTPPVVPPNYLKRGCQGCWAIVPIQNVESVMLIKTGQYIPLSVQQVIDCTGQNTDGRWFGCNGGNLSVAYKQMKKNGLTSLQSYPANLTDGQGPCMIAGKPIAVEILGYDEFFGLVDYEFHEMEPPKSLEKTFEVALFRSPISINIYANQFFLDFRGTSIIEIDQCPPPPKGKVCNHCVLLVGFGCDRLGNKFWLIQNTWGCGWGHNGLARLRRGVSDPRGVGGIHCEMSFRPVLK